MPYAHQSRLNSSGQQRVQCDLSVRGDQVMNTILCTGWLQKAGTIAYTPAGRRKLMFDVMLAASAPETEATPWRCEIADPELIARVESKLTPGTAVILQAELHGRPFREKDVIKGYTRYLAVTAIEFSRVAAVATTGENGAL